MYIWDLATYTPLCVVMNAHSDGITTCCWSDVGTYVVTGSNDFKLKLWNTNVLLKNKDEPSLLKERSTFLGHTTTINDVKYKVRFFFSEWETLKFCFCLRCPQLLACICLVWVCNFQFLIIFVPSCVRSMDGSLVLLSVSFSCNPCHKGFRWCI